MDIPKETGINSHFNSHIKMVGATMNKGSGIKYPDIPLFKGKSIK